jgi:SsrA-binding protein
MSAASPGKSSARLASNRKALRDYTVLERLETGIELHGTEVKSLRSGQAGLTGGFARVENGEVFLYNLNIPPYDHGNRFNHEPDRPRRLLLHRREIRRLEAQTERKGCALVPLSLYLNRGKVKVELGVCRGKSSHDKRETLRRKTADREAERAMARHSRGK